MHWYYRADRTNNRNCWYMQPVGLQVRSPRKGMPSNPTPHIAIERISAPFQTEPTELSQLEAAETESTDALTPFIDEPTADFEARWSHLPKSVDLGQQEATTRNDYASEPATSGSTKPVASTGLVAADSNREVPHKSARAVYFWSIFLAGTLSTLLFSGILKVTRWLYSYVARCRWTPNDYAETNPSELVRALRRVDASFDTPRSPGAVTHVANQEGLTRSSRRPHSARRRFETILAEAGESLAR